MKIHPRIYKEARALFWPWCAVMLPMFLPSRVSSWLPNWLYWLQDLPGICVLFGSLLLAALSFSDEFQCRTLPMLFSQPCSRLRLWSEKMLVLLAFLLPLFLGFAVREWILAWKLYGSLFSHPLSPVFDMSIVLACTMGYWTLLARSTLGGMALSLAALGAVTMTVAFAVGKIWEGQPFMVEGMTPLAMSVAGLAYAALFLWLSWWKFSRLELNASDGGESGLGASSTKAAPTVALLRCGSGSPFANLARKELRLLLPLLGFAMLFALFWLAQAWLVTEMPSQRFGAEMLLQIGTVIYMALTLTLAGSLPLCEERALGLHLTNLTLPVAVRVQWRIKLLIALAVGLAAGVALPVFLSEVTAPAIASPLAGLLTSWQNISHGLAMACLLTLLGFWSATMVGRVTHAILMAALTIGGFYAVVRIGIGMAGGSTGSQFMLTSMRVDMRSWFWDGPARGTWPPQNFGPPEWFTQLTAWVAAHGQLSAEGISRLVRDKGAILFSLWPVMGVAALAVGVQAWRAFRVSATRWSRSVGWLVVAVAVAAGMETVLLRAGVSAAASMAKTSLVMETEAAFNAVKSPPPPMVAVRRWVLTEVTLAELEATGKLSAQTKYWLRNATMRIQTIRQKIPAADRGRGGVPVNPSLTDQVRYFALVIFPGGEGQSFDLGREFLPP